MSEPRAYNNSNDLANRRPIEACQSCGHTAGYHTTTTCLLRAGGEVKRPCDCSGWASRPAPQPLDVELLAEALHAVAPQTHHRRKCIDRHDLRAAAIAEAYARLGSQEGSE